MKQLLASLTLISLSACAHAQAPVFEPMPDDSRDGFVGLGLRHAPSYEGSALRRWQIEPLLQMAWSQGAFISGAQAGWHLGRTDNANWPRWDWGPLLSLQPGRDEDGRHWIVGSPEALGMLEGSEGLSATRAGSRLQGMNKIATQLHWGGFLNLRLSPQWQWRQTVLRGSEGESAGLHARFELQHSVSPPDSHHSLSFTVGAQWGSARFNRLNHGVSDEEALRSGLDAYAPDSGWTQSYVQLRWNWALSPQWLVSSALHCSRLIGPAARSPLVERATASSLSTALVYRF